MGIVWLDHPRLDGGALVGRYLSFNGWAAVPGGLTSVEVSVAGHHRQAVLVGRRADAERALPGLAARCEAFAAYIDLGDVTPGRYELVVRALGPRGSAQQSGPVHVDPSAVYRIWLDRRRRARDRTQELSIEERAATLRVVAVASGGQLAEALGQVVGGVAHGVVAVDPGTTLLPEALTLLRHALGGDARADAAYGDGEVELPGGQVQPYPRQGWSAERLLAGDTVGPVLALGPRAARAVIESAPTAGDIPSSVYGLAVRLIDAPLKIVRVPELLSRRRRLLPASGDDDDQAAVAAAHRRRPEVTLARTSEGLRDIRWNLDGYPQVTIVIPSQYARGLLDRCLHSIAERTDYGPLDVVVVDSSGVGATQKALDHLGAIPGRSVAVEGPFNFSRAVNLGAQAARGEFLLFLNDDTEIVEPDWITRMVELAQLPGVGVVGAKLLYADGSVQHGGVSVAAGAVAVWHTCLAMPPDAPGFDGELIVPRDCAAVTGACMLVDRDLFERLDGFDEAFPLDLGDTDLCLRAREMGRRVVFTPHATVIHHESATRGPVLEYGALELFAARWGESYADGDPVEHPSFAIGQYFRVADTAAEIVDKSPALVGSADPIRPRNRKRRQSRSFGPDDRPDIPERFLPDEFRGHLIDAEHQARYRWAARLAPDAEVLDAACGVGYGAAILSEAGARRVVGIDRDNEAILNARARAGEVAEFLLGDLRTLPSEESSFDLVTCFEAIEHVVEEEAVLDELQRVLRQDGTLLISSPDREALRAALGPRFANVRLYGQHAHLATLLAGEEALAATDGLAPVPAEVRKLSAAPAELYTVAAASNAELPVLDDIVTLGGVFEVRQLLEYAWGWEDRAIAAEAEAAANLSELNIARLARRRAEELAEESERARRRILTSKAWTVTAPLRRATHAVRRRRRLR